MLELYRLTPFAGFIPPAGKKKKPIGSKRWLKHIWRNWNLQPHNIASLYNTSLFAKLQFYLIELFTEQAMPQSPAAAIVWFQTAKTKNTKQSNQKTNMNEIALCGVESIVFVTFEAGTTKPRSATWHTKGCHTITEGYILHGGKPQVHR